MDICEIIDEQISFLFIGRINILYKKNSQLLGFILLKDGELVQIKYDKYRGKKALEFLLLEVESNKDKYHFVVEPEVVDLVHREFSESWSDLKESLIAALKKWKEYSVLAPPANLKVFVNADFIYKGNNVDTDEFSILEIITDYNKISGVYEKSNLYRHQITSKLVSLKLKNAIRVQS
jgi:hypothetical protein